MTGTSIPAETRIGHVHLKVADLDRAIGFYRDYLGFDLLFNFESAAFLSAGGYHHHIGLNTWESKDGPRPAPGTTGLYHFAINYPMRKDLAVALKRLLDHGWSIDGASDHGTHEAIYLWPGTGTPASGRAGTGRSRSVENRSTSRACSPSSASRTRQDTWRSCRHTNREGKQHPQVLLLSLTSSS